MKINAVSLLLLVSCLHLYAGSYAQRFTFSVKNVTLEEAIERIERRSGYTFWMPSDLLDKGKKVSLDVRDASIETVLERLFRGQQMAYSIVGKTIVVKKKDTGRNESSDARGVPALEPRAYEPVKWPERIGGSKAIAVRTIQEEHTVKGKVVDEKGAPVPGANILLKGSTRGTATDLDGNFELVVPDRNAILVISFVGYLSQEQPTADRSFIQVALKPDLKALEEVVVIGYGAVKKSDLTGSVAQVKAKEINAFPNANVLQALSGRAAGVHIRQESGAPGSSISVRVRGGNSIQGGNEPLYVIDGFPVQGNPTHLNTSDIESVEVLKDASATAIYGSRGANGVVIISTKKGKAGRTNVDFETSFSSQKLIRKLDLMNAKEYAMFYNEQAVNDKLTPYFSQAEIDGMGEGFDWQDFVFRTAPVVTSSLNINGGNEKTLFSVSGSYFGQQGIVKGSDYNRFSLQTSIDHKVGDKFRVNFSGTMSRLLTGRKDSEGGARGSSMIAAAISAPPTLTPYNEDGSYRVLSTAYPFIATDIRNPINFINEQYEKIKANVVLANLALSYNFTPDLILKVSGGIENRDDRTDKYTTTRFFNSIGSAGVGTNQLTNLLNENTLSYIKTFGEKHTVSAVAGFTYQDFLRTALGGSGSGYLSDIFESYSLGSAEIPGVPSSAYSKSVLLSYLGRINYSFNERYLATVSLRRDGSSRYSEGMKWGYFPSAALAWRISNENFLKNSPAVSDLKLRTSWGVTGNQAIDPYFTLNQLGSGRTIFNDGYANTFAPGTRLPGNLRWEATEQFDAGFDLGLFANRLVLTADYYVKNTRDLLSVVALPTSLGYSSTYQNVGKIRNRGVELSLDAGLLKGAFTWNLNTNISFNKSKVVSLYNGEDILRDNVGVIVINDATSILREGRPVGQFWGYREAGYDENGKIIFEDINGDGSISQADKTYIGDPNPDFIYGINSNMSYKGFELNIFFQGTQGNDIFNASAITNTMDYGFGLNMPKSVFYDHWTPQHTDARYPRISLSSPTRVSDRYVEDGSYLRLKNIQLSYNVPTHLLGEKTFRTIQVYASGQNLLTFTKYSWWDPETNFNRDHNGYPNSKSFTAGLKVGF